MSFVAASANADLESRLKAFSFFAGLSKQAHDELVRETAPLSFDKGTRLLEQGSSCKVLLLVERGRIRVHKDTGSGKGITLYMVDPGEVCVLGVSSILSGSTYQANASVDVVTDALAIPAPIFQRLYGEENSLRQFIMDVFSHRLGHLMMLVEDVAFRNMDERLAQFLLEHSKGEQGVYYPVSQTHEQIAANLGTAREVVSRLLHQFVKEGMVSLERGRVLIADPQKLKQRCR